MGVDDGGGTVVSCAGGRIQVGKIRDRFFLDGATVLVHGGAQVFRKPTLGAHCHDRVGVAIKLHTGHALCCARHRVVHAAAVVYGG